MAVDVSGISSNVFGIVGTGMSLGVLAGTTGMVMRSAERRYEGGYRRMCQGYRREYEEEPEYRRPRTYKKRTTRQQVRYAPRYAVPKNMFYDPYKFQGIPIKRRW